MPNKNNTKLAATFTVSAALLTVLAPNSTLAAPNNATPIVSPLVSAKTVQFTMSIKMNFVDDKGKAQSQNAVGKVSYQKPGLTYSTMIGDSTDGGKVNFTYVSDGKISAMYDALKNEYLQGPMSPYDDVLPHIATIPAVQPVPAVLNGERCLLFTETDASDGSVARYWIDSATHLPVCEEDSIIHNGAKQTTMLINYTGWKLNAPVAESLFSSRPKAQFSKLLLLRNKPNLITARSFSNPAQTLPISPRMMAAANPSS